MRVAKEKLLLIAGFVWLAAGLNIAILGVSAFTEMGEHAMLVLVPAAIVAFTVFHAGMFSKLVGKHAGRIEAMEEDRVPFWRFFDAKGYLIMAFMMTMGIGLRSSGIVPTWFIAFFYAGLGIALALSGCCFLVRYFRDGASPAPWCPIQLTNSKIPALVSPPQSGACLS